MFIDNIKMAIESIRSNKMRTFLTMLGIIIGIFSVITVISVGGGARHFMVSQFEELGSTVLMINVRSDEAESTDYITMEDIRAIRDRVPGVRYISPLYQSWAQAQSVDNESVDCVVIAGTTDIATIQSLKMSGGRFYTEEELDASRQVAFVDEFAALSIFGHTDVVGEKLDLSFLGGRARLTIVGVQAPREDPFVNFDQMGYVYMPITTFSQIIDRSPTFSQITLMAENKDVTELVGNNAVTMLETRHNNAGRDVYQPTNFLSEMDSVNSIITMVQLFITSVAAISLLVGGIGVMNIMLVSVTERTREIGIRKALGAKIGAIQFQFLTESAILTFFGGVIGIVLGYIASAVVGQLIGVAPLYDLTTISFAVAFSIGVGLVFGVYPARKAARLSPIDALRHD
jgi:putative ABC transport system permease protein